MIFQKCALQFNHVLRFVPSLQEAFALKCTRLDKHNCSQLAFWLQVLNCDSIQFSKNMQYP